MEETWRVGKKVPINVYEGDRPVCQCHTADDARRIVRAMNREIADTTPRHTPTNCRVCHTLRCLLHAWSLKEW